jgi:cation diffusion facilitator CzcD-associated flavoprotein CzcO
MQESKWDGDRWQVTVSRVREDGIPETILLRPRHIIQATGQAGEAHIPTIKGMSSFKGFMCHSSKFRGAPPCTDNRHAVVVGCGNSAHDIAQDYFDQGWKVTMIQRSSTAVDLAKYENGKGLYRENGPSTRDADLVTQSIPTALLKRVETEASLQMKTDNQDMFENLANRGFILDWGPDGSG